MPTAECNYLLSNPGVLREEVPTRRHSVCPALSGSDLCSMSRTLPYTPQFPAVAHPVTLSFLRLLPDSSRKSCIIERGHMLLAICSLEFSICQLYLLVDCCFSHLPPWLPIAALLRGILSPRPVLTPRELTGPHYFVIHSL